MKTIKTKKIQIVLVVMIVGCMLTACEKGGYKVPDEKNADAVYTCTDDNMFGLEKVVVFPDKIITVFDKKASDNSKFGGLERGINSKNNISYVNLSNLSEYKTTESEIFVEKGKYVCITEFTYDEKNKVDPDKQIEITGVDVMERRITFNGGNLELYYSQAGGECSDDYWQEYDSETDAWSEIDYELVSWPFYEE